VAFPQQRQRENGDFSQRIVRALNEQLSIDPSK
jgi:hypothetical protein